jgi:hypothetical protein
LLGGFLRWERWRRGWRGVILVDREVTEYSWFDQEGYKDIGV